MLGGGGEDLAGEHGLVVDALQGLSRRVLVRFFLAVARAVGHEDAAEQHRGLEDGVILGVVIGVHEFEVDAHVVFLGPLNETRLVVLLGLDEVFEVEVLLDDAVDDKRPAGAISLVDVDGSDECLEGIATDVTVVRRGV